MTVARVCRVVAIVLALIGAIDPAVPRAHSAKPVVSLVRTSGSTAFGDSVAAALAPRAEVVNGLTADAAAVVVAGDRLPDGASSIRVPGFVVPPPTPSVTIDELSVPSRAHLDGRVPVTAAVHVRGGRNQTLSVALTTNGVTIDQVDRPVSAEDAYVTAPLTFVPSAAGAAALRVIARLGTATSAAADALTTVDTRPWNIFVFDRRPAWMSTFVRRALESDNRFAVTSRTVTSRSVATDTPNAPADLSSITALTRFDAILVGAPDALTTADVAGLDAFMRCRGGSVVLLWDVRPTPGAALTLTGVDRWTNDTRAADRAVSAPAGALRASDISWPATLPTGATALARIVDAAAGGTAPPVVWAEPAGAGELVVSGALDSWRYRAQALAAFDAAWQRIVADAADRAMPPLAVSLSPSVARPGQPVRVAATIRDVELASAPPQASMTWRLEAIDGSASGSVGRAWPAEAPGRFAGEVSAPDTPGRYRLVVSDGAEESAADLVVDAQATAPGADSDALEAWAAAHGGRVGSAEAIAAALPAVASPTTPVQPWHPMRSGWWIVPMTLLVGIEWWTRRRRGLP